MKITKTDYLKVLKYYKIVPDSKTSYKKVQEQAEDLLADKLCRCIKTINPTQKNESKNIAMCTNSILKKKGLKSSRITCKKGSRFNKTLKKSRKNLALKM